LIQSLIVGIAALGLLLTSCAPTPDQLKKAVEKDPSIVFVAIEKDPEKFLEIVNKAAREAQQKAQAKAQSEEEGKREEEFKNPLKPEIQSNRAISGSESATITVVEYSDFECPYCSRGYQTVQEVRKTYGDKVRFVFKHMPLDFHPKAMPAAKMFEAIARQSPEKAYKFHDLVFENQNDFKSKGEAFLKEAAKKVGADLKKIDKDLADATLMDRINADMEEAKKFGITGTPGYIINGVSLKGAYPFSEFKSIIDRQLGEKK
jgi:protein-disulfide isomerase